MPDLRVLHERNPRYFKVVVKGHATSVTSLPETDYTKVSYTPPQLDEFSSRMINFGSVVLNRA